VNLPIDISFHPRQPYLLEMKLARSLRLGGRPLEDLVGELGPIPAQGTLGRVTLRRDLPERRLLALDGVEERFAVLEAADCPTVSWDDWERPRAELAPSAGGW
jgi:hypothetical protein